jgi:hypothetical protein
VNNNLRSHLGVNLCHVEAGSHTFDMIVDYAKERRAARLIYQNFAHFGSSFGGIRADKEAPQQHVPKMNNWASAREKKAEK